MTVHTEPDAPDTPDVPDAAELSEPEHDEAVAPPLGRHARTYMLTWSGVWAVALIDIKRRNRDPRSLFMLGLYLVLFTLLAALAWIGSSDITEAGGDRGANMFGVLVYLVLGVGFACVPLLSAASVNGDAHNGVLSTLQRTQLTPAEIAVGKLLAAWNATLVLILMAMPGLIWAYVEGGTSIARMLITLAVLALTLLAACAIGIGWSALVGKVGSAMLLTALTLGVGAVGLPILFGMVLPLTERTDVVTVSSAPPPGSLIRDCYAETQQLRRPHSERIWWLLAVSPLVIVADAGPARGIDRDPLTYVREATREARLGPRDSINTCQGVSDQEIRLRAQLRDGLPAIWPLGVFVDGVLTLLFLQLAIERLRTSNTRPAVRGSIT